VSQSFFITVLAVLTAIVGTVFVVMVMRRREEARADAERAEEAATRRARDAVDPAAATRRTIDDYAIPVGFDSRPNADDEVDIGKICPTCGARYASHHRFCQKCGDSELAALN
jgi:ribosomal protein L40E